MPPAVQIVSANQPFAELLCAKLQGWGLRATTGDEQLHDTMAAARQGRLDVLLLDVRQEAGPLLRRLADTLNRLTGKPDIILINTQDGISASMEGMRLGAAEELTTPLDATALHQAILAAAERRRRTRKAATKKRSLLGMLEQAMTAATFAQAGEFDTAMEFINETRTDSQKTGQPPDDESRRPSESDNPLP